MKGSITTKKWFTKRFGWRYRYIINWYDTKTKTNIQISKDFKTGDLIYSKERAQKLLSIMQGDAEKGGTFRLERYTREVPTDVIPYLSDWLEAVKGELKPATYRDYNNSIKNHLLPFFEENPVQLHEIQWDVLLKLKNWIPRAGKGKMNVMYCLHACLDHAWRSGKISRIPPFPKKKQYKIKRKKPKTVTREKQIDIIGYIEPDHQPIIAFLMMHFRRPGEACALMKDDYRNGDFTIHRTFSDAVLTNTTKTGEIHEISMVDEFKHYYESEIAKQKRIGVISPFFFVNPQGKNEGKHYTVNQLRRIWNPAAKKANVKITLYQGTKHSSCDIFLNEKGGTIDELQTVTDHARRESVLHYGEIKKRRRKELMERKVVVMKERSSK
ncbi:tyrosine-type recombinase/integrase [Thermodesulfobacteriota bacterium]